MTEQLKNDNNNDNDGEEIAAQANTGPDLLVRGYIAFGVALTLAIIVISTYFINFSGKSGTNSDWGTFGDFVGGILNPLIGLATIYLVLINVKLQRTELQASLAEMRTTNSAMTKQIHASRVQDFQQTFFTWLNSYREIVKSIQFEDQHKNIRFGTKALHHMWSNTLVASYFSFQEKLRINGVLGSDVSKFLNLDVIMNEESRSAIYKTVIERWEGLYASESYQLDSMFRTLYRLIRWVDEQPNELLSPDEKWKYVSIVRAQITQIEMYFMFFNGTTARGQKFVTLINKYALLDNYRTEDPALRFLLHWYSPFNEAAFSSDIAKTLLKGK